jgi:diacylglycerol kinase (ATP)
LTVVPVIVNPTAGGGRSLRFRTELESVARAWGVDLQWRPTAAAGDGEILARAAAEAGEELVLAYGGDGTYNEVARGLLGSDTALGVVPGGTTSVLAYELAVPRPPPKALPALLAGADADLRVGATDRGDTVLLMLSSGPDAVVVRSIPPAAWRRGGKTEVLLKAVRLLLGREPMPRLLLEVDGEVTEGGWVIAGKARCYAGPYHATPGADPSRPGFEVVVQRSVGRLAAVGFALGIPFGRHLTRRDVVRLQGEHVVISGAERGGTVPYQVDGDAAGMLPVTLTTDPRCLRVRLPGPAGGGGP